MTTNASTRAPDHQYSGSEQVLESDLEGVIMPGDVDWFPSDKFSGYLWGKTNSVWVSAIQSKQEGAGNLSRLFDAIWATGRSVKVPTPFARMEAILLRKGFTHTIEQTDMGGCDVWVKSPARAQGGKV